MSVTDREIETAKVVQCQFAYENLFIVYVCWIKCDMETSRCSPAVQQPSSA